MDRNTIIEKAKAYLGKPYVWGGESDAEGGFDCSGYAYNVLRDAGFKVTRNTANGYRSLGTKIDASKKQPGDLLFFGSSNKATHIAIYAGDSKMYESIGGSSNTKSNPGKGVTLSNLSRRSDLMEVRSLFGDVSTTPVPVTPEAEDVDRSWLQKGDKGNKVKDMQIMLIMAGFSCGTYGADGSFGPATEKAVIAFQTANGLKVDGFYGPKTKAALESVCNGKTTDKNEAYSVGKTYTLQAEMKVRTGPGTTYAAKAYKDLTADGKRHDADGDGALDKGTVVTCKEVSVTNGDVWIKTPSGWIAAIYRGKIYIK